MANPLRYSDSKGLDVVLNNAMRAAGLQPIDQPHSESTFTITTNGVCSGQDVTCAASMKAAGIPGPYYGQKSRYSTACVLSFGLAVKVPVTVVGNKVVSKLPAAASRFGAGAFLSGAAEWIAAIWANPLFAAAAAGGATAEVLDYCEIKEPTICEDGK